RLCDRVQFGNAGVAGCTVVRAAGGKSHLAAALGFARSRSILGRTASIATSQVGPCAGFWATMATARISGGRPMRSPKAVTRNSRSVRAQHQICRIDDRFRQRLRDGEYKRSAGDNTGRVAALTAWAEFGLIAIQP